VQHDYEKRLQKAYNALEKTKLMNTEINLASAPGGPSNEGLQSGHLVEGHDATMSVDGDAPRGSLPAGRYASAEDDPGDSTSAAPERSADKLHPVHAICAMFPEMDQVQLDELTEDIRNHGLLNKIVLYRGQTIDGRTREKACLAAGVKPEFIEFEELQCGLSVEQFVWSQNAHRRNLTADQLAALNLKINFKELQERNRKAQQEGRQRGGKAASRQACSDGSLVNPSASVPQPGGEAAEKTPHSTGIRADVAKSFGISEHKAKLLLEIREIPALFDEVVKGGISISKAAKQARPQANDPTPLPDRAVERMIRKAVRAVEEVLKDVPDDQRARFKAEVAGTILKWE
jgi:hypothetical protein